MIRPGSKEWWERVKEVRRAEYETPLRWFYCSFADDSKGGFLGGIFIEAHGVGDCSQRAHLLGINPGGEMVAVEIPEDAKGNLPAEKYRNKLLTKHLLEEAVGPICHMDGSE